MLIGPRTRTHTLTRHTKEHADRHAGTHARGLPQEMKKRKQNFKSVRARMTSRVQAKPRLFSLTYGCFRLIIYIIIILHRREETGRT